MRGSFLDHYIKYLVVVVCREGRGGEERGYLRIHPKGNNSLLFARSNKTRRDGTKTWHAPFDHGRTEAGATIDEFPFFRWTAGVRKSARVRLRDRVAQPVAAQMAQGVPADSHGVAIRRQAT